MKFFFTCLLLFFVFSGFSQKITFDFAFIKAENINDYDQNLKTKFQKVNQNYIDDERILGWHVWKVLNGSQTPFIHVAVSIYDLDIADEDYTPKKWTEIFPDLTEDELKDWGEKNSKNRKIILKLKWLMLQKYCKMV